MSSEFFMSREFIRGAALKSDFVALLSKGKNLIEQDISHSSVVAAEGGEWRSMFDTMWDASAIAISRNPNIKLILIGEDGDVIARSGGQESEEKLPTTVVAIRSAQTIDGNVYACGMQRQVFHRVGDAQWLDMSAPRPNPTDALGFEAINGYSKSEIYAVGWSGELWQYDGKQWLQHGSLTDGILTAICCAPDGSVYIAGQRGIIIKGRGAVWNIVEWDEDVGKDFWDLCWFNDRLYVATATGLLILNGNHLDAVDMNPIESPSCFSLTQADGVLWSIGPSTVASFDGKRWRAYE